MGKRRIITVKISELPIQLEIDADNEDLYREGERELSLLFSKIANVVDKSTREQVFAYAAYELMIKKLKMQNELISIEKEVDRSLAREHED